MILRIRKWGSDDWAKVSLDGDPDGDLWEIISLHIAGMGEVLSSLYHVQAWNPETLGWDELGEGE